MMYTKDFAFIHVPKTAGMSIKKSIEMNCPDAIYMPKDTFSRKIEGDDWRRVMHYPYSYWEPLIKDKWVFSFVRNPYVRAVSFYVFYKTLYDFKERNQNLTFEDMFTKRYGNGLYVPTMTQTECLTGLHERVPNVFKHEDGYAQLEKKLGFRIDQKRNVTPQYKYLDYYDEKRQKLILNLFEKDFENFSYDTELKNDIH